jgi:predicted dehydrogenase
MISKKKLLVIGGGRIALSHLPHLIKKVGRSNVTLVEPNLLNRTIISLLFKIKTKASLEKINKYDFDIGVILTPPHIHRELALILLEKNISCFIEKPLSLSIDDTRAIYHAAKKYDEYVQVGYVYRYNPIFLSLKKLVVSEKYGKLKSIKAEMFGNVVNKNTNASWRTKGPTSGVLFDYGSHVIDTCNFLLGVKFYINNYTSKTIHSLEGVDAFKMEAKTENDIQVDINCNWCVSSLRKASMKFILEFDNAQVTSDAYGLTVKSGSKIIDNVKINEISTDCSYYLRGEDFSMQWDYFFEHHQKGYSMTTDYSFVDEILSKAKELQQC